MKNIQVLTLFVVVVVSFRETVQDHLEYNFEIKNGKNTLVVSKKDKKNNAKKFTFKKPKKKKSLKKESSGDNLGKMVKLGVLIDRITDRLEKDQNKSKKSLSLKKKKNKKNKKSRKAFMDAVGGVGGMAAIGGAAALGGGLMAGAADNANLEAQIDQLKLKQTNLYIKDRIQNDSLTELHNANKGFAVLKIKAKVLMNNFGQKFGIAFDHISEMLNDIQTDYHHLGVEIEKN